MLKQFAILPSVGTLFAAGLLCCFWTGQSHGAVMVASGGYTSGAAHLANNVLIDRTGGSATRNAYFVFDLTTEAGFGPGTLTSATLTWTKVGATLGTAGSATISLFDVSSTIVALTTGGGSFADLGGGTSYGSVTGAVPISNGEQRIFTLNAAALAALNAARTAPPNQIAFGATISASDVDASLFSGVPNVALSMTFAPANAVPEPSSLLVLASVTVGAFHLRRMKKRTPAA